MLRCLQMCANSNAVLYDSCLSTAHYDVLTGIHLPAAERRSVYKLRWYRARYQLWVELYGFCPRTKNSSQRLAITDTPTDGQRLSRSDDRRTG